MTPGKRGSHDLRGLMSSRRGTATSKCVDRRGTRQSEAVMGENLRISESAVSHVRSQELEGVPGVLLDEVEAAIIS